VYEPSHARWLPKVVVADFIAPVVQRLRAAPPCRLR
jgi:hypothetical protein